MAMKKKGAAKGGVRKMKPGGRAGTKKPDNSAAKKKHTLDTHQGGKRIRSDKQAAMIPRDFSGKASSSGYDRPHKTLFEMDTGPTPNKKRVGRAGASLTKKKAGGAVTKKMGGGMMKKKGMAKGGAVAKKKAGGAVAKKMGGGMMKKKGMAKGGAVAKKKAGGAVAKKMGGGKMMKKGYAKGGKLTKKMGKGGTLVRGTGAQRSGRMARGPMG